MEVLFALVLVAAVAAFVVVPLRGAAGSPDGGSREAAVEAELVDLELRKQAKYREIRDTELDHAAGKLDAGEFARQDAELRAEAIALLKRIDELEREGRPREPATRRDPNP